MVVKCTHCGESVTIEKKYAEKLPHSFIVACPKCHLTFKGSKEVKKVKKDEKDSEQFYIKHKGFD